MAALNLLPDTPGFYVTPVVLALALGWVLLFPLVTLLFRITRHRRSLATGTDSSVKLRDRYERSFGTVLVALVGAAAFESLPYFLDRFHFWAHERGIGWPDLAAAMAAATVAYSVSDKVLSLLGGVARKVALVAIGAIGLVVPLLVVLFVADFLVFADLANWDVTLPLLVAIAALPLGILRGARPRRPEPRLRREGPREGVPAPARVPRAAAGLRVGRRHGATRRRRRSRRSSPSRSRACGPRGSSPRRSAS